MQTHYLEAIVAGILTAVIATAAGIGDRKSEAVATPAVAASSMTYNREPSASVRQDRTDDLARVNMTQ